PAGVALNQSQQSLAGYFDRSWNNADPGMAQHFAALSRASSGSGYSDMLNSLSSRATHAQSIALVNSAGTILGSSMSCPAFEGQSTLLREGNCVWGQVGGRWSDQDSSGETIGYDVSNTSYRVGVQHQIAPNWYLGGSAAIGQSWAHIRGGSSGDGDIYDGSITLKHIKGPWQVAGSLALASGSFDNHRQVSIPGVNERLDSDSDT
ncbi:autotransporter domain-containing protein, partial [Bordetella tumulicola]